jgi:hypothetical protein
MKVVVFAIVVISAPINAWAWGEDGHSIVAEIAQRRLSTNASNKINAIFGAKLSIASVASWADDHRNQDKSTANWHFVDIPINNNTFDPPTQCKADDPEGDCIIAELDRLKTELRCKQGAEQKKAAKLAIHFLGDIHQPLHTVADEQGGNNIIIQVTMRGQICTRSCIPDTSFARFHDVWDSTLIQKTVRNWGAYVTRLEAGWLTSPEAKAEGIDGGSPIDWALETHKVAHTVWTLKPGNNVLHDDYYNKTLPTLDRQLGVAGLRLARFLNEAYSSNECPVKP